MEERLLAVEERVDRLESILGHFIVQTNIALKKLEEEVTRLGKQWEEMSKRWEEDRKAMNKRWGELANKMGTLVEDIFAPSLDLAVEKYFNVKLKDIIQRRIVRRDDREIEIDLLAYSDDCVFIVEVKSSPDRVGYVDNFIEKLKELPEILPELKRYKIVPIYAGLSMRENTIEYLTKNNIYAMVVKGDILEIVNFEVLRDNK
ncbi:hypothetical protein H5T89_05080 [bacterium]|nr:hypothetical protein [bacterium]